jgi:hypothetical protein
MSERPHDTTLWKFNAADSLLERRLVSSGASGEWKHRLIIVVTSKVRLCSAEYASLELYT